MNNIVAITFNDSENIIYNKYIFDPVIAYKNSIPERYMSKNEVDDLIYLSFQKQLQYIKGFHTHDIGLYIGDECNMNCNYCLRSNIVKRKHNIKHFKETIKFIHENNKSITKAIITGGDPFYNINNMIEIIDYIKLLYGNILFIFDTNGTIFNKEIISLLKNINYEITLSLDGNKEIHDSNRIFRNLNGSFDTIMRNLNNFNQNGIKIESALATINDNSIYMDVDEFVNILNKIILNI
jgi:uncharacterized protein